MGAGGARSGGGGSGVPDMIRPPKVRRKEIFKEKISKIKTPATAILKGIGEQIKKGKEERAADKFLGTADYQGSPTGRKSRVKPTGPRGEGPDGRANEYRPPVKIIKPKTPKPKKPKEYCCFSIEGGRPICNMSVVFCPSQLCGTQGIQEYRSVYCRVALFK